METKPVKPRAVEAVLMPPAVTKVPAPSPNAAALPGRNWAEVTHRVMDAAGAGGRILWKLIKLAICIALDLFDFTVGRVLGLGIGVDIGCALICAAMWGRRGWWVLWEVVDITEQLDAFIPTCTIVALRSWNDG